jgi:hypothetical protein
VQSWHEKLTRLGVQGIGGLYKGIGVAAVGSCPAACVYFGGKLKEKRKSTFCHAATT